MNAEKFDVGIVGAGLGGLITAAILSKEGKRVFVLEKNKQIGGCLQSFGLDGKRFESAVHYMGSLDENQTLRKIFDYLEIYEKLSLQKLDLDCFDRIILNNEVFAMAQGYDNFIRKLSNSFPHQQKELEQYISEVRNVCNHFPLYNMRLGSNEEKSKVTSYGLKEKLNLLFTDEKLKQVIAGNNQLYAGDYDSLPFYIHALIMNSYIEGSWKFKQGSAQLAKLLQDIILQHGGAIYRNQEVVCLKEIDKKIIYAQTKDESRFFADDFISNLHPGETYKIVDSDLIRPITLKRINSTKNTIAAFMVNLSLKEKSISYPNCNIYYHKDANVWKDLQEVNQLEPNSYGLFFLQDPKHPEFASGLSILTYLDIAQIPYGDSTYRTTSYKHSRGMGYENWKEEKSTQIIQQVENVIPALQSSVLTKNACTPLTYRDYLHVPQGSMYGFQKDVHDLANTTYSTHTKIKNLFLTGQNINLHGVLGVSITAVLTCGSLIGLEYLVNKINNQA